MGADADALIVIATHLRPEEAGMIRGLLESAGIASVVRDEVVSSLNPFLQPAIGGVKVAVRAADEERARELLTSAPVFAGGADGGAEIPEEEWSRGEAVSSTAASAPAARPRMAWAAKLLLALLIAAALAFSFYGL
ncbi:MAG: DUF2007 domain-containing protein [Anaeromyxobacteraceae bacterium]